MTHAQFSRWFRGIVRGNASPNARRLNRRRLGIESLESRQLLSVSFAADDTLVNASEAAEFSFSFADAEVGSTYTYSISSSGGAGTVTGIGAVGTPTDQVTKDISSLADGLLTISVTLTDPADNETTVTTTSTLDQTSPTGTISADETLVNAAEATTFGFTFADAEVGAAYTYTITSSGGSGTVTGGGTIATATDQVIVDVSSLADGLLTVDVTLTDAAGNTSSMANMTATLDQTSPTGTIAANDTLVNASDASAFAFTFAAAEVGATYTYTITSSGGAGTITGDGTIATLTDQVTKDISSLADGTLTISVALTDAAGNTSTLTDTTATLDKTAPAGTIAANDSLILPGEAAAFGFTFAGAEVGATYVYTITSSGGAGSVTGNGTIATSTDQVTADVSSLADGTLTISVTMTDTAGNESNPITATSTLAQETGSISGYVYLDTNNDGRRFMSNGTTHRGLQGVVVSLYVKGDNSSWTFVKNAMTDSNGYYRFSDLTLGTYRVVETQPTNYTDGKETLGKINGTAVGTVGADKFDNIALGAGEDGVGYNFGERGLKLSKLSAKYFLASYITGSATTQVNSAPVVRLSAASSSYHNTYTTGGSAVVIAGPASTITDSDGTMLASMTATITNLQDGAAEVLTVGASNTLISSSYGNGVLTLSGVASLSDYQKLLRSITYNNSAVAPTAGVRTITVVANDGIVNSAAATSSITVSVGATNYSIKANDATVNASEASAFGFTFTNAEVGATYEYTITSSGGGTPVTGNGTVASANQQVTNIDVSQLTDGTLTVSVTLTDTDNHVGNAVTATAKLDTTVTGTIAANSTLVNASEASAFKFTFAGAEVGATYTYTIASSGGGSVTGNGTIATATDLVTKDISSLLDGTLTITVVLTDAAGNTKTVTDTTATLDKTAPTVTVNQASTQSDPTNDSPIYFTVTFSEVVTGFDANDVTVVGISGTPSIVVTDSGDGKTYNVAVSGMVDGETVTVTVAAGVVTDTAGNANAASTSTDNSVTCDTAAPTGYSITANDDTVNASESTSFGFTFADAEVGATYTYTITSSGGGTPVTGTGVITAADQQVTGINLSGLENGTLTISVTLTDPAGNAGAAAETTATLDMTV